MVKVRVLLVLLTVSAHSLTVADVSVGSKPGKSSGGGNSHPYRGCRRREPVNGSLASLNQQRPGPKTRAGAGKRPPAKGNHNNYNNLHGKNPHHSQLGQADEFELGSIFNPGSKKQNYNHLLNFNYGNNRGAGGRGGGGGPVSSRRGQGKRGQQVVSRPRYDQSHFLQANCQFTVRAGEDYSLQLADPDILVSWEVIEQVKLRTCSEQETTCPVCLFPPVAAQISRCGHVFCWACVLHYLALSDDTARPCPICHQEISKTDLRSVIVETRHSRTTGDIVTMNLMKRERNSLFAVPVSKNFLADYPEINHANVDPDFVKMFTATPEQVKTNIIDRERRELERQWQEEKDQPESCFIQEALKLLDQRELETSLRCTKKSVNHIEKVENILPSVQSLDISSPSNEEFLDPFAEDEETTKDVAAANAAENVRPRNESGLSSDSVSSGEADGEEGVTVTDLDISTMQELEPSSGQPRQIFYFYQSSDGQPLFLHALNVQMLVKQFGALEKCPLTIEARILEKEGAVMSEQLRDRLRYLKHLPITTNFEVAELDLSNIVDKDTFDVFKDQIETRKKKRNRKMKEEKRREKKIQEEEARMMGYPGRMVRVESDYMMSRPEPDQFPAMTSQEDESATETSNQASISFANVGFHYMLSVVLLNFTREGDQIQASPPQPAHSRPAICHQLGLPRLHQAAPVRPGGENPPAGAGGAGGGERGLRPSSSESQSW